MNPPLVLLSNDDGVAARGITALRNALYSVAEVVVVAPETNRSACSHAITMDRPLRYRRVAQGVHAVDGTPADCVYVALYHEEILPRTPDLVVAGVNHGPNLGNDVFYSGTVAAAREGALRGISAIAVSLSAPRGDEPGGGEDGFAAAAAFTASLVARMHATTRPPGPAPLLNINVPGPRWQGVRATRLGRRRYDDEVRKRQDPRGRPYLWLSGPGTRHEPLSGSDTEAIDAEWISITPLGLDASYAPHLALADYLGAQSSKPGQRSATEGKRP